MPELPEMENYRRILSEQLLGKTVSNVLVTREKSINLSVEQFTNLLKGRTIIAIERRGKYLIFQLDSGNSLLLHLMLGGLMYIGTEQDVPKRTKQITLSFGEKHLYFIGLRLGYLHHLSSDQLSARFSELGPEPLESHFTADEFLKMVEKKKGMLKTMLINQKFLAGIGNLYSDEICFDAKLLPKSQVNEITVQDKIQLFHSIKQVLQRGLQYGGYIEMPVYQNDQLTGRYNEHCYVYGREGEPCLRCGTMIKKEEISSRKSFYCPACQK
ncbi:bifunctional DNA-formamidopyrimidine glycosylase/DNA-(apurinic or apyrimidinic site) lyase [Halalkalibacter urbisdiaboli]|uniref:bifunctional DNA-formamidopyrimidine glycosylase/DNA-(apurinic or apyrimidinic site) lyase n=1 Tax=Halalkalibacter urbisdiaboli TaxID=1960589 RepID=UPI000B4366B2|nr:bifunctional DNA-formamidopyrimidine glycosylase/DNA-(apurinic or apyrimidinic site) lyase [Halalkalibacter urbisdiaboli]